MPIHKIELAGVVYSKIIDSLVLHSILKEAEIRSTEQGGRVAEY